MSSVRDSRLFKTIEEFAAAKTERQEALAQVDECERALAGAQTRLRKAIDAMHAAQEKFDTETAAVKERAWKVSR